MSIEKDIQENTAVIRELIAVLTAGVVKAGGAVSPFGGDHAAMAAKVPAAAAANARDTSDDTKAVLTFDVLKPRFLALVKTNRAAAEGILKTLGLTKLTEAKLPQYPDVDKALKAAGV